MKPRILVVVLLVLTSVASGCSYARVIQSAGPVESIGAVRDVQVMMDLDSDREDAFRAYAMSGAIRRALLKELKQHGKLASDGPVLEFTATGFRLRSTSTVLWVGVMAGSDYLTGTAAVKQDGNVLKSFEASARGTESLWSGLALWRLPATRRADLFCRLIARKIADQL
jgi:hypothetical protein